MCDMNANERQITFNEVQVEEKQKTKSLLFSGKGKRGRGKYPMSLHAQNLHDFFIQFFYHYTLFLSHTPEQVLAMMDHPNIIGYYDTFEEDGTMMIEMEYADGGTLEQFLSNLEEGQGQPSSRQQIVV